MNFDEALQYLLRLGHETSAIKLGLATTKLLLRQLNNPHRDFLKVQIAGTNGKGSTAQMLNAICRAAGISTGLYTSPHLISITERIRVNGTSISQGNFARLATTIRVAADQVAKQTSCALPTFFEQVTLIALLAFREQAVQLAILETGLGGRLDATTAARAEVVALTPIALDHQEYLGDTLEAVAAEKAAIVRSDTPVVIVAPQPPQALGVIEARCRACGVTPCYVEGEIEAIETCDALGRLRVTFKTEQDSYPDVCLGLRGRHQAVNAAVAVRLAEALRNEHGLPITRDAIIDGLESVEHAGRLELIPSAPPVLLDGAHNAAGAESLHNFIREFIDKPLILVFGAVRDKDLSGIARLLFPLAECVVLTEFANPRCASHRELRGAVPDGFEARRVKLAANPREALATARQQTDSATSIICVTGSLYLVGETKSILDSFLP